MQGDGTLWSTIPLPPVAISMGPAVAPFESANSSGGILALGDGTQWPVLEMPPGESATQQRFLLRSEQTGGKPRSKRLVDMRSRDFDAARGDCYGCIAPPPHPTVHADKPIELRQELVRNIFPAHKHCHDFLNRAVALATTG